MKYLSLLIIITFLSLACSTPREALEKGRYQEAFRLAKKQLKKGKDWDENIDVLRISSDEMIRMEIEKHEDKLASNDVYVWVKVQNRYYNLLDKIGAANILVDGEITDVYDGLCSAKKDLDFKIVDDFYSGGNFYLSEYDKNNEKVEARDAYYEFEDCIKYGGETFFNDLEDLMDESHEKGIVYFIAYGFSYRNKLFLKELPDAADFDPDCEVDVSFGFVNFYEETESFTNFYSEDVEVGQEEIVDTSGTVTYKAIYEEVTATVTTTKTTLFAKQLVRVGVENVTGQCTISRDNFTIIVSDSYTEINIIGDERAVPNSINENEGEPIFFKSHLEDDLNDAINSRLLLNWN